MNTKINLTFDGQVYTLEYNRMSIKMLEKAGFKYEEFLAQPITNIELAFSGAFVKNHSRVQQSTIDKIFDSCSNKNELVAVLAKMISECYESLLAEPEENSEGNAMWEIVDTTPSKKAKSQE